MKKIPIIILVVLMACNKDIDWDKAKSDAKMYIEKLGGHSYVIVDIGAESINDSALFDCMRDDTILFTKEGIAVGNLAKVRQGLVLCIDSNIVVDDSTTIIMSWDILISRVYDGQTSLDEVTGILLPFYDPIGRQWRELNFDFKWDEMNRLLILDYKWDYNRTFTFKLKMID